MSHILNLNAHKALEDFSQMSVVLASVKTMISDVDFQSKSTHKPIWLPLFGFQLEWAKLTKGLMSTQEIMA